MEPEIWQGLRETYRPQQIKTLFVAESPSRGQRFFIWGIRNYFVLRTRHLYVFLATQLVKRLRNSFYGFNNTVFS